MKPAKLKFKLPLILIIAFIAIAVIFPFLVRDRFLLSILVEAGVMCLFALGFAAVLHTGQLSLGQAAFAAIGGYMAAILATKSGTPFWLALLAGGAASAVVAFLLGIAILRIGGLCFSIATLALGEIAVLIAGKWDKVTQGFTGIAVNAPVVKIGDTVINFAITQLPYYYIVLLLIILAALVFWRINHSRLGRIVRSVAVSPILSEHLGVHLTKYRVIIFILAAFITGVAGAFYVYYSAWVGPSLFSETLSLSLLIMCAIGGLWSPVAGPVIGAIIVTYLSTLMQIHLQGLAPLVFGVLVIVLIWVLPNGLVALQYKFPMWVKELFKKKLVRTN
jgi:branched-chain amino acid transport system permease protein